MLRRPLPSAAALVVALAAAVPALAQPADEHAAAANLVTALDQDTAHKALVDDPLLHAKEALERATRMRGAGDEARAKAADGLALEWAETARDLVRAADAEAAAADLRKKALDTQAQLERSRGLVEEAIASIGRLRAELEQAEGKAKDDRTAVEQHDGSPPPPKKKPGKKSAVPGKAGKDAGGTP